MAKPLTVTQMRNRFQEMIDNGYGSLPVISSSYRPTEPYMVLGKLVYIGPSPFDSKTYAIEDDNESLVVIV